MSLKLVLFAAPITVVALGGALFLRDSSWKNGPDIIIERNLIYKTVDGIDLKGDLFLPKIAGMKPAVIVLHGGGWSARSGDMERISQQLAQAGYVVFAPTYRLAPRHIFPKALEDVRDAVKWMKEQSLKYEIDTERMAGWGYSAGGHLILLAGLDPSLGLKALVSGGTPADLTAWPNSLLVKNFMGSSMKAEPELWKEASPVNHVDANSPPVFLYHGAWDGLVEVEQMEKMRQALLEKHRTVETHTVSYMGHIAVYLLSQESVDLGIAFIDARLKAAKPKATN